MTAPAKKKLSSRSALNLERLIFDDSDRIFGEYRNFAEGCSAALCGPGGAGKSRIMTQIAACQRLVIPFCGMPTYGPPRNWLFIQSENNMRRQQSELHWLREWVDKHYPGKWEMVASGLIYHTLETDDDGVLQIEVHANLIADLIAEHSPGVPVVDPLKDFTTGDLNSDKDMMNVVTQLIRIMKCGNPNRAPLFLHHSLTGRLGAQKVGGYDRGSFGRNSKVLMSTMRSVINVMPINEDNNDRLAIFSGKNNNGKEFKPFAIELNTVEGTDGYMLYSLLEDFDVKAWQEDMESGKTTKKEPKCTPEMLIALFKGDGTGLGKTTLARLARDKHKIGRTYSFDVINEAIEEGLLIFRKKLCYPKK
jgi:hypothetical protein